jgi:uncharacterized protein HemX
MKKTLMIAAVLVLGLSFFFVSCKKAEDAAEKTATEVENVTEKTAEEAKGLVEEGKQEVKKEANKLTK